METVLVLGATGNLGAYSAIALKNAGYRVIATGKRKSDNGFFALYGIPYYSIDITMPDSFSPLLNEEITTVAHFAGELPSRCAFNPQALVRTITEGTLNVLEFMRKVSAKKIIFPQTPYDLAYLHETGNPMDPDAQRSFPRIGDHSIYTIAKNAAVDLIEHYHHEYGISRFIFRFFTIYQYHPNPYHYCDGKMRMMPYRMLMDRASRGEPICIFGDPNRVKEIVYIKDFTQAVEKAVASDLAGGFYNIGCPKRVTLDEMIKGIVEIFAVNGKKSEISYDPLKPDTLQSMLDMTKTKLELGYEPQYSYLEMLRDFKKEMDIEPFKQLWGTRDLYEQEFGHMCE